MITVKEMIHLPGMQSAIVRSGKHGLGRAIQWVHVIDHDDVGYFLEGGELLLTCGQIWPKDQEAEMKLLKLFLNHQIAGIVFAVGRYLQECPKAVLAFGEKYAIPIIEVPFQVQFVKLTRTVHQEIMKRQYKKGKIAANLSGNMTKKLEEAKDFSDASDLLSQHLNCTILISDHTNKIVTRSIPTGETINISKIMMELNEVLMSCPPPYEQYMTKLFDGDVPFVRIPSGNYSTIDGFLIGNKDEYYGAIWVVSRQNQNDQKQKKVLEHAVTIVKELILREKDVEAKRRQLQAELLELLLEKPKIASIIVEEKMDVLSMTLSENWLTGIVTPIECEGNTHNAKLSNELYTFCTNWIAETEQVTGFCEKYEDKLVLILSFESEQELLEGQLKKLHRLMCKQFSAILLVGRVKSHYFELKESYKEAMSLMTATRKGNHVDEFYFAERYRREILLYGSMSSREANELVDIILPDELRLERGEVFYETLKCLMLNKYNREQTAKELHIHRNTLRYRIEKIEQILGESLNSYKCQFWIQIAFDLEPIAAYEKSAVNV
jgi:PucR family transcriptional regulator, purine catabolism regulatory protein